MVVCIGVMLYIFKECDERVVRNLFEVVDDGGFVIFEVWN